jgi:hypothetical protein
MQQLLNRIPDDEVIGLLLGGLGILCGTAVILAAIGARCWTRHRQRQVAEPLIREMLARGMSGHEIAAALVAAFEVGPARRRSLHELTRTVREHEEPTA